MSSSSFVIQLADLNIEICGYNDTDSVGLHDLKRLFCHHAVERDVDVVHRIIMCPSFLFNIPSDATSRLVSTYIGVAAPMPRRNRFLFFRKKEVPQYSGTGKVDCYRDDHHDVEYYVPEDAEWRIGHNGQEHVTYVYFDGQIESSDGLPSMLIHIIGSQYGYYLLYASCVAVGGEALLFTGNSGVGKSTLCLDLVKQGATYLGDDLVLVYMKGGQAMTGSLLFPVKSYSDRTHTHKKTIDVVAQQRPPLNVPLKSIFLLRRTYSPKDESYIKPMLGETMFEMMLKLTNKANTHADGHHFVDTLSSICDSVPCRYLFYGDRNKTTISFIVDNDQR